MNRELSDLKHEPSPAGRPARPRGRARRRQVVTAAGPLWHASSNDCVRADGVRRAAWFIPDITMAGCKFEDRHLRTSLTKHSIHRQSYLVFAAVCMRCLKAIAWQRCATTTPRAIASAQQQQEAALASSSGDEAWPVEWTRMARSNGSKRQTALRCPSACDWRGLLGRVEMPLLRSSSGGWRKQSCAEGGAARSRRRTGRANALHECAGRNVLAPSQRVSGPGGTCSSSTALSSTSGGWRG